MEVRKEEFNEFRSKFNSAGFNWSSYQWEIFAKNIKNRKTRIFDLENALKTWTENNNFNPKVADLLSFIPKKNNETFSLKDYERFSMDKYETFNPEEKKMAEDLAKSLKNKSYKNLTELEKTLISSVVYKSEHDQELLLKVIYENRSYPLTLILGIYNLEHFNKYGKYWKYC